MEARSRIKETKEAEQRADTKVKMKNVDTPTILQKHLSTESSIFDFSRTVSKTLTDSVSDFENKKKRLTSLVENLNQELKILRSEREEPMKVEEPEEVVFLADEVTKWVFKDDVKSVVSSTKAEDGNNLETLDEIISTMLGDGDDVEVTSDEFLDEMLKKIEKDGSKLEKIEESLAFGGLLAGLLRDRLSEKVEKEEKEISLWIGNEESDGEAGVVEEEKKIKKSPMKVSEEECSVTKRDYSAFKRRWYLIERLRERDENNKKRREEAMRFGVELSFFMAQYMFLIPNELLATKIEDYWMTLKRLGVNKDDKGTSIIILKLEEVCEIVMRKIEENKDQYHNVNVPKSFFGFDDYILLCTEAIQVLGKIVWGLRKSNQSERVKLCDMDSWFEHCQNVLVKIELKLAEMKQQVHKSIYADYESFSKTERWDRLLLGKVMRRCNVDNRFGRSGMNSYLVEIWNSVFEEEALQEQKRMIRSLMLDV